MEPLTVGVPREIKPEEHRVAITPDGVRELLHAGAEVLIETGAGADSSIPDDDYRRAGATIVATAAEVWERAELVCKVKEPLASEFEPLPPRPGAVHLPPPGRLPGGGRGAGRRRRHRPSPTRRCSWPTARLPLLAPMSEVAGRMSVQVGAHFLERHNGGRGVLLGGAPGVRPARVVVLGAGNVGWNAAWMAAGLEAEVDLLDKNIDRLRFVDQIQMGRITTLASNRGAVERVVAEADLVIGAVLVPGGRAPTVVSEEMVRSMKPGAVIIDIAIDQGGCVETSHETTHADPVFELHGVIHYAVGNMPGAVPHTSTHALTNTTLPYLAELARLGPAEAARRDPALAHGFNVAGGRIVNAGGRRGPRHHRHPLADALP